MLQAIKAFALLGGEWVLYILLGLSVWSIAVIWDRFFLFRKKAKESDFLEAKVPELLLKGQIKEVQKLVDKLTSPAAVILKVGIANLSAGPQALEQIIDSQRIKEKMALESNLLVLGTLGSNAPFIGLFGTVLGIIKAFNDLALAGTSGPTVVMRGVSEALVATAVGLLIAIPCVATYNYFQNWIKRSLSNADRLSGLLLAYAQRKGK
ncbi:MAG TPA: MotA/TolQ/ExbB proton channel family protein [bacterium]|jgi:biopolymer transport protein ExbB/TolQ|nr:MotA/TolQ/ExbB proton channel family protein [bacterium]